MLEKQRRLKEQKADNVRKLKKALEKAESHKETLSEGQKESEGISETGLVLKETSKESKEILKVFQELLKEMEEQEELL